MRINWDELYARSDALLQQASAEAERVAVEREEQARRDRELVKGWRRRRLLRRLLRKRGTPE